jgi:predicted dehydrogenase
VNDSLGVAVIGTGWMARAHTHALRALADLGLPGPRITLRTVVSRDVGRAEQTATQLGYESATSDWRTAVDDSSIDIVLNVAANRLHAEPSIAALAAGKHVVCEKPLATQVAVAESMVLAAADHRDSTAVCAYNYRFVPAVRLTRDLIAEGRLGTIRQARFSYLQDWAGTPATRSGWRFAAAADGSSVADYSHIIDLLRWMVGEPVAVSSSIGTLDDGKGLRHAGSGDHEDWYAALVRLDSGATALLEASRVATGSKGRQSFEVFGSEGAVSWDMEDLNRLRFYAHGDDPSTSGPRDVLVTEPGHPYLKHWWAPGHILGWEHTLIHQWIAVLESVAGQRDNGAATFADGLQASRVVEAIQASSATASWTAVAQPPMG